jgi:hypothetical protein
MAEGAGFSSLMLKAVAHALRHFDAPLARKGLRRSAGNG